MLHLFALALFSISNWVEYQSYGGKFRVVAPVEMEEKIDSVETALGVLAYHVFYAAEEGEETDNALYMVSYCDYPEGSIHSDSTELLAEFFEATMDQAAFSINGTLMYSDLSELDGFPGRMWRIDYKNKQAVIRTRAYVVNNRYYAVQVVSPYKRNLNAAVNRFLDSFQLLK